MPPSPVNVQRLKAAQYSIVVLVVLIFTVMSIKWNMSIFQIQLDSSTHDARPVSLTRLLSSNTGAASSGSPEVPSGVRIGSGAYFALDSVRAQLVSDVQSDHTKMLRVMESTHPIVSSQPITRAIIIYLPPGMPKYEKEVKAMYLSIAYMRSFQPANVKTDLIIYTPTSNFDFPKSMGCSIRVRASFEDPEGCVVLSHIPLHTRGIVTEPLNDYSIFIDSMLILAEFALEGSYTYVMRSDSDTFLTPGFADWPLPEGVLMVTGKGGYGSPNAEKHLAYVASVLGLSEPKVMNVGSTWYGRSSVTKSVAILTLSVMRWLDSQEFSEYEKTRAGTAGWPYWHWKVILLYAGHIAVNQLPPATAMIAEVAVAELDASSEDITVAPIPNSVKHIHCWETNAFFSKYKFQNGAYHAMNLTKIQDMSSLAAYSAVIAMSSDRISVSELIKYTSNPVDMKNKAWLRLLPTSPPARSIRTNTQHHL